MSESKEQRVRIDRNEDGSFSFKYLNMTPAVAREVCRRAAMLIRSEALLGQPRNEIMYFPMEPNESICLLADELTVAISINGGMDSFESAILCDHAAAYIDAMLFPPHSITELAPLYGGILNGGNSISQ